MGSYSPSRLGDVMKQHPCTLEGCSRIFTKAEHLKRHLRSRTSFSSAMMSALNLTITQTTVYGPSYAITTAATLPSPVVTL